MGSPPGFLGGSVCLWSGTPKILSGNGSAAGPPIAIEPSVRPDPEEEELEDEELLRFDETGAGDLYGLRDRLWLQLFLRPGDKDEERPLLRLTVGRALRATAPKATSTCAPYCFTFISLSTFL